MSNDWDVVCLDCQSRAGFHDANHADKLMEMLAEQGPVLARISRDIESLEASARAPDIYFDPCLYLQYERFRINTSWWREHGQHRLAAIDEYHRLADDCGSHGTKDDVAERFDCRLRNGHHGPHSKSPEKDRRR